MTQVPENIFRKYDIRGTVTGDQPQLTPDVARLVGKGYGTYMIRTFQRTPSVFQCRILRALPDGLRVG